MIIEHLTLSPGISRKRDTSQLDPAIIQAFSSFQVKQGHLNTVIPDTPLSCYLSVHGDGTAFFFINYADQTLYNTICCFSNDAFQKAQYLVTELLATLQHRLELDGYVPTLPNWLYSVPIDLNSISPALLDQADDVAFYIYYALYLAQLT